jgi:transcriptional regulator with XRE-family HTH domain
MTLKRVRDVERIDRHSRQEHEHKVAANERSESHIPISDILAQGEGAPASQKPVTADRIGDRIRVLRQLRGLDQQELADAVSVSRSSIAQWETNRTAPRHDRIYSVASILGVSAEALTTGLVKNDVAETLTSDEAALLDLYRSCDVAYRARIMTFCRGQSRASMTNAK